ncbi:permease-like cell division protein FtsX [Dysosmobacter sp.]|jgi:cell division transport system permease protein|uniref:permease-like cell division protein FtsX n=1 Tax=Dysosmobacter sp. TaxID=2591382 RepID=UPI002D80E3B9|nr:permease-like cell division protein FtsX [uncultured Oscillibacter sp.]
MSKHNFGYFVHEGLSNMFSHGFMSFAAIGITVACLLIMGTFTLVAVNANELLHTLEQENEILAYVDDTYTDAQSKALESKLEALPNVASVTYISKEEAMESFKAQYPDEEVFQDLDPEILQDRYAIKVADLTKQAQTKEQVENVEGITDVNAYEEITSGFITVRNVATVVCVALIAILFIVSVFIISNTIKLTTFDRREEIAIMRMVGATNGFIRWPFVYEGFMLGFLGAVIAFGLQWLLYAAVARGVATNDTLQLVQIIPFQQMWLPVALTFGGAGILIGVGGSLSAIRRFLQV